MANVDPYAPVCRVDGCPNLGQFTARGGAPERKVGPICEDHAYEIAKNMEGEERAAKNHARNQMRQLREI